MLKSIDIVAPRLSVIIPVYNVECYVGKCLESVLTQTETSLEIIVVNDGSTDGSLEIVKKYSDPRIKLINQRNQGLSAARNAGMREAAGEYIAFVDSDDWVEPDSYKRLLEEALLQNLDVLIGDFNRVYPNGIKEITCYWPNLKNISRQVMSGSELFVELSKNKFVLAMAPLGIYKREYLLKNKMFFTEGLLHEDELWCPIVLLHAATASYLDFHFYNYLKRENSITSANIDEKKERKGKDLVSIGVRLIEKANVEYRNNRFVYNWLYIKAHLLFREAKNNNIYLPRISYFSVTKNLVNSKLTIPFRLRLIHHVMMTKNAYRAGYMQLAKIIGKKDISI